MALAVIFCVVIALEILYVTSGLVLYIATLFVGA